MGKKREEIKSWFMWQINSGVYKSNERLLSENQTAIKFNCSRQTAREALRELVEEGFVVVKKNMGYFVSLSRTKLTINPKNGRAKKEKIQIIDDLKPTEQQLHYFKRLGLTKNEIDNMDKSFIKTYFNENNEPFVVIQSFITNKILGKLTKEDLKKGFGAYLSKRRIKIAEREEYICFDKVDQQIKIRLLSRNNQLSPMIFSKMTDENNELIEIAVQYFKPEDFESRKITKY